LELSYVSLENATKARGRVIDSDFAAETQSMATQQILMQSAQSILAQANSAKQNLLSLIG
jgi:flagellin